MPVHEHDLNQAVARALDGMRRGWSVSAERTRVLKSGRPDIVVRQKGRPAVLIENEFVPAAGVEDEARSRLGKEFQDGKQVRIAVAMRSPASLRNANSHALDKLAAAAEFHYALFSGGEDHVRFPESGWLSGSLADLAGFVHRASVPADAVQAASISLEKGVQRAAKILQEEDESHPDFGAEIEKILQQEYSEQTRRMAMTILANALAFHDNVVGCGDVKPLAKLKSMNAGRIHRSAVMDEWEKILKVDFWPIFRVAQEILLVFSNKMAQRILDELTVTAEVLSSESGLVSHDLFGGVFQRLISDRKFLATFYTRPASAALLANLAIPEDAPFADGDWKNNAKDYVVADFACGTGALLTAAYQRVAELHERAGGDAAKIHPAMMEHSLVGCDVMPAAAHLTASILSAAHPNQSFADTRIYSMPYGEPKKGEFRVGSLELLDPKPFLPVMSTSVKQARGKGQGKKELREIPWRSANLVIMNPPFTRPTNHEGAHRDIPNPAFAAFGADEELQRRLGERSKDLRENTCGSGNAGVASDFVALADKMIRANGMMALVLPISALAGESWKGVRDLWMKEYQDILVVTLSASGGDECAFSADTSMGEALFIGRQINGRDGNARPRINRAAFAVLDKRPENEMEAAEVARVIRRVMRGKVRRLEDGPVGGTRLTAGKTDIGGMLDAPVSRRAKSPWTIARLRDFSLAQTAYAIARGRLWLPREARDAAHDIPVCPMGDFARRGFIARDINGMDRATQKPRGPFDIGPLRAGAEAATYPCLWGHDAKKEAAMLVEPDGECAVRIGMDARARKVWESAGRAHFSGGFRFNSQPLAVAMTARPSIGGPAWLNIVFRDPDKHEEAFALWGNSTLGLLLYWWWANKQHDGRGQISPLRLSGMPTLNVPALSPAQLSAARKGFNALKNQPLLPFYRAAEDKTRAEIDRMILCEVLGLPKKILSGVALAREKLCAEPTVHGGKKNGE